MIFEVNPQRLPVSAALSNVLAAFTARRRVQAATELLEHMRRGPLTAPNDVVMAYDVLVNVGAYDAVERLLEPWRSAESLPAPLALGVVRNATAGGRLSEAERALEYLSGHADLYRAVRASVLAVFGRRTEARALMQPVHDAISGLFMARTALVLRDWHAAIAQCEQLLTHNPHWTRLRVLNANARLGLGDLDGAYVMARQAAAEDPETRFATVLAIALGLHTGRDMEPVVPAERLGDEVLQPPLYGMVAWGLARAHRFDEAKQWLGEEETELRVRVERAAANGGRRVRVPASTIVQSQSTCVPTSVAMALGGRGIALDPEEAYREMRGASGVPSYRLDAWLESKGIAAVAVGHDLEAIKAGLDLGAPALATHTHLLSSHMTLVVGYDDALQVLEIADPMSVHPVFVPYESMSDGMRAFDEAPLFLFAGDLIPQAEAFRARYGSRLQSDLRQVVRDALALRPDAARERFFALDPNDVDVARTALRLQSVLAREDARVELMQRIAGHPSASPIERLMLMHDLMARGEKDAAAAIADSLPDLPPVVQQMGELMEHWRDGEWQAMADAAVSLIDKIGEPAQTWWQLSVAQNQLGLAAEAQRSLDTALAIDPHLPAAVQASMASWRGHALAERRERLEALLEQHPLSPTVRFDLADTLVRMGHFEQGKEVVELGVKAAPMSPAAAAGLREFWLNTQRVDLAAAVPEVEGAITYDAGADDGTLTDEEEAAGDAAEADSADGWRTDDTLREQMRDVATATPFRPHIESANALAARAYAGELPGHLSVRVRGLLLKRHVRMQGTSAPDAAEVRALLPSELPMPRAAGFTDLVYQLLEADMHPRDAELLLEWSEVVLAGLEVTPAVRLARGTLLALSGRGHEAVQTFEHLADEGWAQACFELALTGLDEQDDYRAHRFLERAVTLEPGLATPWPRWVALCAAHDLTQGIRRCREWVKYRPYCPQAADTLRGLLARQTAASEAAEGGGVGVPVAPPVDAPGDATLGAPGDASRVAQGDATLGAHHMLSSRLGQALDMFDLPAARAIWEAEATPEFESEFPSVSGHVRRYLAVDDGRWTDDADGLVEAAIAAARPGWLLEIAFAKIADPARRRAVAERVLVRTGDQVVCGVFLDQLPRHEWTSALIGLAAGFVGRPAALQALLLNAVGAVGERGSIRSSVVLLEWARTQRPGDAAMTANLRSYFRAMGSHRQPYLRACRALLVEAEHAPVVQRIAAQSLLEADPDVAEPVLRRHSDKGDVLAMGALADACLMRQRNTEAAQIWHQLLRLRPDSTAAMGSVVKLDGVAALDWPTVRAAVERWIVPADPFFAVAAALCAMGVRAVIPVAWADVAWVRLAHISPLTGWGDEWSVLVELLEDFYMTRGGDGLGRLEAYKSGFPVSDRENARAIVQTPAFAIAGSLSWKTNRGWVPRAEVGQ